MSYISMNGIWRNSVPKINLNDVWRDSTEYVNTNGVWRSQSSKIITANDISKFEMVYIRTKDVRHSKYYMLRDNRNIPATASVTSDSNDFDLEPKSFVLEYTNDRPEVEGLQVYTGILNAILTDDFVFPVSNISISDDVGNMNITVSGYTLCEPYGPPPIGWNRLFSTIDNLPSEWNADKKIISLNSYSILPAYSRSKEYGLYTQIGIARNMSDRYVNMVGSKGVLDHTISQITLNGNAMPFKITIYE